MEIVKNKEKNGIELYFGDKPAIEILEQLKQNGFRWHRYKKCWYAKENEVRNELAQKILDIVGKSIVNKIGNNKIGNNKIGNKITEKAQENYLGVKVGDIFYMSWGYEQTNVDFFRVEALKGKTQVVLKEVKLKMIEDKATSWASADRVYDKSKFTYVEKTTFVKDNNVGMTKKVCGTKENPYINMTSYANAYLCKQDKIKTYESWYY